MKTLKFIGMAILAIVLCVNFAACSNDEDEQQTSNVLAGTTWKVVSVYPSDDMRLENVQVTFHPSMAFTFNPANPALSDLDKYLFDGKKLVLYDESEAAEYYLEGTLTINGNEASFTFYNEDFGAKYTVNMEKVQ